MRDLYDFIFNLPQKPLTLVALLFGLILIDDLTPNEQNSLGNFIMLVGQVLETSAAQGQLLRSRTQSTTNYSNDIERLKKKIEELEHHISILNNKNNINLL